MGEVPFAVTRTCRLKSPYPTSKDKSYEIERPLMQDTNGVCHSEFPNTTLLPKHAELAEPFPDQQASEALMPQFEDQHNKDPETIVSPFESLGVSEESVSRFLADRDRYDSSKHVCICGHAINKHSGYEDGFGVCQTARHYCPCVSKRPVLFANDTRYFMRKTFGLGSKHALSTGLKKLAQVGKNAYWLEEPRCWNQGCSQTNNLIFPVSMDKYNHIVNEPGPVNVFLCETCILNLKGAAGNEGKGWVW